MASDEVRPHTRVPPTRADDVSATHSRWWQALLHADASTLEILIADDLTFHSPVGRVATKAEFVDRVRSGWLEYTSVAAENPLIRVIGDAAIVTGRADIQYRAQGQPRSEDLYYTAVYGWSRPQWRMLAWQSTVRADARP